MGITRMVRELVFLSKQHPTQEHVERKRKIHEHLRNYQMAKLREIYEVNSSSFLQRHQHNPPHACASMVLPYMARCGIW